MVGTAAGFATVSGTLVGRGALAGAAHGIATASAYPNVGFLAGVAAGAATVAGSLQGVGYPFFYNFGSGTPFPYDYNT